jgi:hypothetical protein
MRRTDKWYERQWNKNQLERRRRHALYRIFQVELARFFAGGEL